MIRGQVLFEKVDPILGVFNRLIARRDPVKLFGGKIPYFVRLRNNTAFRDLVGWWVKFNIKTRLYRL